MTNLLKIFQIILVLSVQQRTLLGKYAEDCITPNNEIGKCMPIKSCATLYTKLLNIPQSDSDTRKSDILLLKKSQCDYQGTLPFACCPINEIQINPDVYLELKNLNCGHHSLRKIANGDIANIQNYRWMALLKFDSKFQFQCGASLISKQYVLTAAHCILSHSGKPKSVRLGEYNLTNEVDCIQTRRGPQCMPPYEDIDIEKFFIPAEYHFGGIEHDIALIRLKRPVEFKENINPICLPITKELQTLPQTLYSVAGWGHTETSNHSDVLRYVDIPSQTREYCVRQLKIERKYTLTEEHICAGGEEYKDSCKGDSGSPLFSVQLYLDDIARAIQYGVVSLGIQSCGVQSKPAIYTNVSYHIQWITDYMSIE